MLPRRHRLMLRRQPSFFHFAHKQRTRSFTVYSQPSEVFQATVIVPKKPGFSSVVRHQVKRQVFSHLQKTALHRPLAIVLVGNKLRPDYDVAELYQEINQLFDSFDTKI